MPVAVDAGNADNLAGAHGEGNVAQLRFLALTGRPNVVNLQNRLSRLNMFALDIEKHFSANHFHGKLTLVGILCFHRAHELAIAHNCDAVRNFHNLVEFMRNKHNRMSGLFEIIENFKQLLCFLRRQNARRLVKNDDVCAAAERLDNLHALRLADADLVDLLIQLDIHVIGFYVLADLFSCCLPVNCQSLGRLKAENDVFQYRQFVDQHKLLMHHADTGCNGILRGIMRQFLPIEKNLAAVDGIHAIKHLHHRRFARAVFSDDGVDFTLFQIELPAADSFDGPKILLDILHSYDILFHLYLALHFIAP